MDREEREADNCNSGVKEFLSLSQILRAIGSYVGKRGARLLSVSNNALTGTMPVVKIEYETFFFPRFIAVLRLYSPVSHFCYKQIHELTVITVIFHNKDFLYHWTFRKVGVDDPTPCLFGLPVFHL